MSDDIQNADEADIQPVDPLREGTPAGGVDRNTDRVPLLPQYPTRDATMFNSPELRHRPPPGAPPRFPDWMRTFASLITAVRSVLRSLVGWGVAIGRFRNG